MPLVQPRQNAIVNTSILLYKDNMMSGPTVLTQSRAGSRAGAGRQLRAVPAVPRAVALLRLLGRSEESLGVHAIARALGLVPSTCLHILRVFVAEALVAFDPSSKRYRLDVGILTIARSALRRNGFAETLQPERGPPPPPPAPPPPAPPRPPAPGGRAPPPPPPPRGAPAWGGGGGGGGEPVE